MQMAADIAMRHDLPVDWVRETIAQARFLPQVPRLMTPAVQGTAKNWGVYRSRFVETVRIRAGTRFWQANAAALARAEKQYGVPAEIIVGIIGVETIYGQQMGNFRVIDALATLSFDFLPPTRALRRAPSTSVASWSSSCASPTVRARTRSRCAAATQAPWAWASSCPAAG